MLVWVTSVCFLWHRLILAAQPFFPFVLDYCTYHVNIAIDVFSNVLVSCWRSEYISRDILQCLVIDIDF